MTLVDEGKIALDDKVAKYIPDFAKYSKGYITIRHCLSHQTGIEQEQLSLMGIIARKNSIHLKKK